MPPCYPCTRELATLKQDGLGTAFDEDSECTRSKFVPVLDTILAASAGAMLAGAMLASTIGTPPANQTPEERQASLREARVLEIGALVAGIVPTASAIWGFHTVRKCRAYEEDP